MTRKEAVKAGYQQQSILEFYPALSARFRVIRVTMIDLSLAKNGTGDTQN
jgi:hypothetical protein